MPRPTLQPPAVPAALRRAPVIAALALLSTSGGAHAQSVSLTFSASDPAHGEHLAAYQEIWRVDGARILQTLERTSGMTFPVDAIAVELVDGPSWAGSDRIGMRFNYPPDTKRATLAHELGHVLIGDRIRLGDDGKPVADHHTVLFLFLYEAWVELWGEDFARAEVAVESRRRGMNDYEGLWAEALSLTAAERAAELRRLTTR